MQSAPLRDDLSGSASHTTDCASPYVNRRDRPRPITRIMWQRRRARARRLPVVQLGEIGRLWGAQAAPPTARQILSQWFFGNRGKFIVSAPVRN